MWAEETGTNFSMMDVQLLLNRLAESSPGERNAKGRSTGLAGGEPMQRRLHECLRAAIRAGELAPGTRMPASRALAQELALARNTVLYAYEQLATEGLIESSRRGTIVASFLPHCAVPAAAARSAAPVLARRLARRVQATLNAVPVLEGVGAFAAGVPALSEFPLQQWRRALERAWRGLSPAQLNYADPAGEGALREAIADHLRLARGVRCEPRQIFITDGTQASLDLCARAFADPGDKAWLESPGYAGAAVALRGGQLKLIGVAVDEEGMAPSAADWRQHSPRLIYTTPSHQYPTGAVLSLARRLELIAQARAHGALIIEDDYDSEFRHDGPPLPAMQGLQADAPVVYLGTFSKTLFPGLRTGFMVVPEGICADLHRLLARTAPRGRVADQLALAEFMRNGQFGLHLRRMRRLYRQRRDALVAALTAGVDASVATVHGGSAGMHLALRFEDARLDDVAISARAQDLGLIAPALSLLSIGPRAQPWRGLLLGYAQVPAEQMPGLVARLLSCLPACTARTSG